MGENQSAEPTPPLVLNYGAPGAARSSRSWGGFIAQAVLGFTIGVGMCVGLIFLLVGYHQQFAENTGQFGRSVLSPAHLFTARGIVVAVLALTVAGAVGLWRRGRWRGLLPGLLLGIGIASLPLGACFLSPGTG